MSFVFLTTPKLAQSQGLRELAEALDCERILYAQEEIKQAQVVLVIGYEEALCQEFLDSCACVIGIFAPKELYWTLPFPIDLNCWQTFYFVVLKPFCGLAFEQKSRNWQSLKCNLEALHALAKTNQANKSQALNAITQQGFVFVVQNNNGLTFFLSQKEHCFAFGLVNFIYLDSKTHEEILSYRNLPAVREFFYTQHDISLQEHYAFVERLKKEPDVFYYCIYFEGLILGCINFKIHDQEVEFGFYANPYAKLSGIGRILEQIGLAYSFGYLKKKTLCLEVFLANRAVVNLHKKFGFVVVDEFIKEGQKVLKMRLDAHEVLS